MEKNKEAYRTALIYISSQECLSNNGVVQFTTDDIVCKFVYNYWYDANGDMLLDLKYYENNDLLTQRCSDTGYVIGIFQGWE
jgi:hypothetical protein